MAVSVSLSLPLPVEHAGDRPDALIA